MAIANASTDLFVALDVDLMPPPNGHEKLTHILNRSGGVSLVEAIASHKTLFVLPAFEFTDKGRKPDTDELPDETMDVVNLVERGELIRFKSKWHQRGHRNTDFRKWHAVAKSSGRGGIPSVTTPSFYFIEYEHSFEPYVLGWRPGMPRLAPEFRGWGKNKMSWFMELHCEGYTFAVLTDFFVVHLNHPDVHQSRKNLDEDRNQPIWEQFTSELNEEYRACSALHQYAWWDAFLDSFKLKFWTMRSLVRLTLVASTVGALYRFKRQLPSKPRRFSKPGISVGA